VNPVMSVGKERSDQTPSIWPTGKINLRKHDRYAADSIYAAISQEGDGRKLTGEPVVLIDLSQGGVSFLTSESLNVGETLFIVLAGHGIITGQIPITIKKAQGIRKDLARYGAKVESDSLVLRNFNGILNRCVANGRSLAPWR